ncbi:hypothetical protein [Herbiconiux liangxiaofengii]|uniref:hypothetical protein n=1 Tax=Herbiconiux liangxiaofengii TaxID=3342795 RepID=UPI0035B9CD69
MNSREAAAYIGRRIGLPVEPRFLHAFRAVGVGPAAEKRRGRLYYRREAIDAFLAEYGTDPSQWHTGFARHRIESLRALGINDPQIEGIFRALDPDPDAWTADDAR